MPTSNSANTILGWYSLRSFTLFVQKYWEWFRSGLLSETHRIWVDVESLLVFRLKMRWFTFSCSDWHRIWIENSVPSQHIFFKVNSKWFIWTNNNMREMREHSRHHFEFIAVSFYRIHYFLIWYACGIQSVRVSHDLCFEWCQLSFDFIKSVYLIIIERERTLAHSSKWRNCRVFCLLHPWVNSFRCHNKIWLNLTAQLNVHWMW